MRVIINSGDWDKATWRERLSWRWLAWRHQAKLVRSAIAIPGQAHVVNVSQMYSEPITFLYTPPENVDPKWALIGELAIHDRDFKGSITDVSNS